MVSPEDKTLTAIGMSAKTLDLDIPLDQMDDLQVAVWRDKYDMWVEELEVTPSGECKSMFEDDIMVCSPFLKSILLNMSGLSCHVYI